MRIEPVLLVNRNRNYIILTEMGRKFCRGIVRDADSVRIKKFEIEDLKKEFVAAETPSLETAVERFLHPVLGVAAVSPDAKTTLEEIMATYNTKASAIRGIKRACGEVENPKQYIKQVDGKFEADMDAIKAEQKRREKQKTEKKETKTRMAASTIKIIGEKKFNSGSTRGECFAALKSAAKGGVCSVQKYIDACEAKGIPQEKAMAALAKIATHPTNKTIELS